MALRSVAHVDASDGPAGRQSAAENPPVPTDTNSKCTAPVRIGIGSIRSLEGMAMPSPFAHQWGTDWSVLDSEFVAVTLWADDDGVDFDGGLTVVEQAVYAAEIADGQDD